MLEIFHIVDNVFSVLMQDLYLTIWSALRQSLLWFGALLIVHNETELKCIYDGH